MTVGRWLAGVAALVLAGCAGLVADATPRETALDLMLRYEVVQVVAEGAVTSPLLAEADGARRAIQAATRTATDAVLAYDDVTRGCVRDGGDVVLVPGVACEPDKARALLPVAVSAMTTLSEILTAYGVDGNVTTEG